MESIQPFIASKGRRFQAYLIDILIITIVVFLFACLFFDFGTTLTNYLSDKDDIQFKLDYYRERNYIRDFSFLIWVIYCIFGESSNWQGSFGKRIVGIKVVDINGERLTFKKSLIRNLAKILSYVIIFLGFVWVLIDKQNRAWHDILGKTYVVNKDFDANSPINDLNEIINNPPI